MNEIIIIFVSIVFLIILKIVFKINIKNLLKFKNKQEKELDTITKKLPNNKEMCREILKQLNNDSNVSIKEDNNSNDCLYMIFNNSILLGNFRADFIRVQTIAHECIHSVQNKRLLWFNYIFSNLYILFFYVVCILAIFHKLSNLSLVTNILIILSFIQFSVRSYLETQAMTKAREVAKEYLEENNVPNQEIKQLVSEYDKVNKIGIPFTNYQLLFKNVIRIIIFSGILLIRY